MANRAFHDQTIGWSELGTSARMAFKTTCVEQLFGVPQTIRKYYVVQIGVKFESDWQAHCKEPSMPMTSGDEGNDL